VQEGCRARRARQGAGVKASSAENEWGEAPTGSWPGFEAIRPLPHPHRGGNIVADLDRRLGQIAHAVEEAAAPPDQCQPRLRHGAQPPDCSSPGEGTVDPAIDLEATLSFGQSIGFFTGKSSWYFSCAL
jgi:hypothetical protein